MIRSRRCGGRSSRRGSYRPRWPGTGHAASEWLVRRLLHEAGYSLQATAKQLEGVQHRDRDAQFRYLDDLVRKHHAAGQPVISVDIKKKKELVGRYKNAGRR